MDDVTVVRRPDERRYELLVGGGHAGELAYRERAGNVVALVHTEVDPTLRRRGLGSALVAAALEDARARALRVEPVCPFVAAYLRRHPGYGDLLAEPPTVSEAT
jgi:predicted GNAT family acetyltransferase